MASMEKYEFQSQLGEGIYGVVFKCRHKESGATVAVKCFKEAHNNKDIMRLALREIRNLNLAEHPNVVKLHEAIMGETGQVYIVMDFVPHSLQRYLELSPAGLPEQQVQLIMWQLLAATSLLHAKRILHRDVTPSNILLTEDGTVKLCDFGFARSAKGGPGPSGDYTTYVTTRWYRAPEVLVGAAYGMSADVWALGCIFAELVSGRPLLPGRDTLDQLCLTMQLVGGTLPAAQQQALHADKSLSQFAMPPASQMSALDTQRFSYCSAQQLDVLRACLNPDPETRATALQVMSMPYFDEVNDSLSSTDLQHAYDAAYESALKHGSSAAPALRATSSAATEPRAFNSERGSGGGTRGHGASGRPPTAPSHHRFGGGAAAAAPVGLGARRSSSTSMQSDTSRVLPCATPGATTPATLPSGLLSGGFGMSAHGGAFGGGGGGGIAAAANAAHAAALAHDAHVHGVAMHGMSAQRASEAGPSWGDDIDRTSASSAHSGSHTPTAAFGFLGLGGNTPDTSGHGANSYHHGHNHTHDGSHSGRGRSPRMTAPAGLFPHTPSGLGDAAHAHTHSGAMEIPIPGGGGAAGGGVAHHGGRRVHSSAFGNDDDDDDNNAAAAAAAACRSLPTGRGPLDMVMGGGGHGGEEGEGGMPAHDRRSDSCYRPCFGSEGHGTILTGSGAGGGVGAGSRALKLQRSSINGR